MACWAWRCKTGSTKVPAGKSHRCPLCQRLGFKVIYFGLPARLCSAEACSCLWAHWSIEWLLTRLPCNGWLFRYEGGYLRALWAWLTNEPSPN